MLANALVGGLIFALVAAVCLGIGGGVAGWFMGQFTDVKLLYIRAGIRIGGATGIFSGFFGAVIFAIITFVSGPGRCFEPLQKSVPRVATGQVSGILVAGIIFSALDLVKARQAEIRFGDEIYSHAFNILLSAFILMICGAIVGALWKGNTNIMKSDARWMKVLSTRVLANAIIGGLLFAIVGALCLGTGGFLLGTALDRAGLGNILIFPHFAAEGADSGVLMGAISGIVGCFIFGIAALRVSPNFFTPLRNLWARVALGQFMGALSAGATFLLCEYINARVQGQRLSQNVLADLPLITYAAPILMICGAIAGALSKRDLPQSATLNAE